MSASAVAKLRAVLDPLELIPATSAYDPSGPMHLKLPVLTMGDLRALLALLDEQQGEVEKGRFDQAILLQERNAAHAALEVLKTPSDNERRQWIRAYVAASAADGTGRLIDSIADAKVGWELLLKEDC